ncbi:MAG: hypothetical protein M1524_01910 [Patescibacteria group bacterium]|nr:hypothetical protein [Patescibacteria group bacterium]
MPVALEVLIKKINQYSKILLSDKYKFKSAIGFIIFISFLIYIKAFLGYFQGDEWTFFARDFSILNKPVIGDLKLLFDVFVNPTQYAGHFSPVLSPISYFELKFFGINFILYQLFSFLIHVGVSLCVFYLAYLISRKNLLFGFVAGLFFAVSSVHFHAVSWIAAVGVQIAMLFSLLSLIFLVLSFIEKNQKYKAFSLLFLVLAVFSKETSFFLFILYPLVAYFLNNGKLKNTFKYLKSFGLVLVVLFVVEIIFRIYTNWLNNQNVATKSPYLYTIFNTIDATLIYKAITWSFKSITQTFIPSDIIYSMGEKITIWGFPYYAQEASVRGTNFLIFTQSAGIEMFMFAAAVPIILGIYKLYQFFSKENDSIKKSIIIGVLIIIFSVLPLIFIVNSLIAKFGYVSLFDSRHLYPMSVGGSLIFASLIVFLLTKTDKLKKKNIGVFTIARRAVFIFLFLWVVVNAYYVNKTLSNYALMGHQRKTIIKKILNTTQELGKKSVFLVKSNTGYYGFGPIPPFQTNLGQALTVLYFKKGQLPEFFIDSDYFVNKGIAGEGYIEKSGRGFGYYIQDNKMAEEMMRGSFDSSDIYAFSWDGIKNEITDITEETRRAAYSRMSSYSQLKKWNTYKYEKAKITFKYPESMQLEELNIEGKQDTLFDVIVYPKNEKLISEDQYKGDDLYLRLILRTKPETLGIDAFASPFKDSDGNTIGPNFTFRGVTMLNGDNVTTVYATKGKYVKYFFPLNTHDKEFEITALGKKAERVIVNGEDRPNEEVERIISTITYNVSN